MQRGNATAAQAAGHYAALTALPLQRTPTFDLGPEALAIAMAHGITAYDASYVALSHRQGVPLITADDKLVNKLAGSPYPVIFLGAWVPPAASS